MGDYQNILEQLRQRGLIYPCLKTRAEIKANMAARNLSVYSKDLDEALPSEAEPVAWRLSMAACRKALGAAFDGLTYQAQSADGELTQKTIKADRFGDVILGRKDIGVSYHIAVTHDDALQNITHIVRGEDLEEQTDIHVLLQHLMGWPTPIYRHHAVIKRADGQKLAKREGDPSIRAAREKGKTPAQIWAAVLEN